MILVAAAVLAVGLVLAVLLIALIGGLAMLTKQIAASTAGVKAVLGDLVIVSNKQAIATVAIAERRPTTVILTVNELAVAAVADEADVAKRTKH